MTSSQHQSARIIHSKDNKQVTNFISHFCLHCLEHNAFRRMQRLQESEQFDPEELEKLDQLFGEAGRIAESKVKKKPRP